MKSKFTKESLQKSAGQTAGIVELHVDVLDEVSGGVIAIQPISEPIFAPHNPPLSGGVLVPGIVPPGVLVPGISQSKLDELERQLERNRK